MAQKNQIQRSSGSSSVLNLGVEYFKQSCAKTQEAEEQEEEEEEEITSDADLATIQELEDYLMKSKGKSLLQKCLKMFNSFPISKCGI